MNIREQHDQSNPFSSALYYRDNLQLHRLSMKRETFYSTESVHLHDDIELLYFHRGEGTLVVNGDEHIVAKGTMACLLPFHVHGISCGKNPIEFTRIRCSLGIFMYLDTDQPFYSSVTVIEQCPPCLDLSTSLSITVEGIITEMEQESAKQDHSYRLMLFSGLMRLVTHFEREAMVLIEQNIEAKRGKGWTVLHYIQSHFNHNIDAGSSSETLGMTPSELNRTLRLLTGMNFQENLALARIRNACGMMQYSELTIPYIARYVGYSSTAAFYRHFKAQKDMTPDQYRHLKYPNELPVGIIPSDTARSLFFYISDHYREPLTVATVAKALYLSESTVSKTLKKGLGMGFPQLLTAMRLWIAVGLLDGTDLPLGDVAYASGFGCERTFSRAFRDRYGCTPGVWRESSVSRPLL